MKTAKNSKKQKLKKVVPFRLSESEFLIFESRVAEANMNKSEFMRECVLKNRTRIIAKSKISIEKKRMLFVFNKAGNNLNQIAHVLNSANLNKKLTETTLRDALLALSNISAYLKTALNYVD